MKTTQLLKLNKSGNTGYWKDHYVFFHGDFYTEPTSYIAISTGLHEQAIFYAYTMGSLGSYRTLEGAKRHIRCPINSKTLYK